MNSLDELIKNLQDEVGVWITRAQICEEEARGHRRTADMLEARIYGIEEARATLAASGNGAVRKSRRRPVQALIRELRALPEWREASDEAVAKKLGVRVRAVSGRKKPTPPPLWAGQPNE
jgi:hypothetical protein